MLDKIIHFESHGDDRGQLVALESRINIPFNIQRVYYIYMTKENVRRGFHAHYDLEQVLVCVNGDCWIHLDNGEETSEIHLDSPLKGLLIDSFVWREMYNFSDDAVLLVLASRHYEPEDYIRDYEKFLSEAEKYRLSKESKRI